MDEVFLKDIKEGKHMLPEVFKEVWEKSEELSKRHPIKIPTLFESQARRKQYQNQAEEATQEFGHSRTCQRFRSENHEDYTILQKDGWELRYFNIRSEDTSDYILFRIEDVKKYNYYDSIPVIEFNCDNHTLKFNGYSRMHRKHNIPSIVQDIVNEFCSNPIYRTTKIEIVPVKYLKLYLAVLDEVPAYIVPTLVAHSMLGAHLQWQSEALLKEPTQRTWCEETYIDWLHNSFRKCVVKVDRKAFEKIKKLNKVYLGHENTTLNGEKSCAIPSPVWSDDVPNVLKFAKLWEPGTKGD